jgi:hypothetical protein
MNFNQINKKMHFLRQLVNLSNKGNMMNAKYTADMMISDNYPCINIEDYNIMKEYQKYCSTRIEVKLMKKNKKQLDEIQTLFKVSKTYE